MTRSKMRNAFPTTVGLLIAATLVGGVGVTAQAAVEPDAPGDVSQVTVTQDGPTEVPAEERDAALGQDWESSQDVAVIATGDVGGFRVQRAREATGYAWETVASLSVDGVETDRWIGNYCVTGDAKKVAVVYVSRVRLCGRGC